MELLCPAGSMEALKAAVNNGADAVYLGGASFNARRFADSPSDIEKAVKYAHIRDCKVYFTLNALVLDKEFKAFLELAARAANAGADAFIVQDLGAAYVLKKEIPSVALHASTQTTVTNSSAAAVLESLGFGRIILARELTEKQIKSIHNSVNVPLEAFAHGALCQSYSGQCLTSSFLGGRSANRGECAQPCRLPYSIGNTRAYLMSAKDLCLIDYLKDLKNYGVSSIKIEGRMKSPEYVAAATRIYRRALDGKAPSKEDRETLKIVFNRGGFTAGKFKEEKERLYSADNGHIGVIGGRVIDADKEAVTVSPDREIEKGDKIAAPKGGGAPVTVIKTQPTKRGLKLFFSKPQAFKPGDEIRLVHKKSLSGALLKTLADDFKQIPLRAELNLKTGEPSVLEICGAGGECVKAFGESPQIAVNRAITSGEIIAQLNKTGGYPFYFESVKLNMDEAVAISKSALNSLRREGLESYCQKVSRAPRIEQPDFNFLNKLKDETLREVINPKLSAYVSNMQQARAVENAADIIYFPYNLDASAITRAKAVPALPPVCEDSDIENTLPVLGNFETALLTTPVAFNGAKIADYTFNITNVFTLYSLARLGYTRGVLSLELTAPQIRDITRHSPIETEAVAYGKVNLMVTANCPLSCGGKNCKLETEKVFLKDRMNKEFLLRNTGGCKVAVLNSVPIFMADKINDIYADVLRLIFTDESPEDCGKIAGIYGSALNGERIETPAAGSFTRGHYYRGFNKYD